MQLTHAAEKGCPAIQVEMIGTAVNNAIRELVSIIAAAPIDPNRRETWLEQLWDAHKLDQIASVSGVVQGNPFFKILTPSTLLRSRQAMKTGVKNLEDALSPTR